MTDRELLEMAAKAEGTELRGWSDYFQGFNAMPCENDVWNPLEDDGDALRLAVRLGMEVYVDTHPEGCACTEAQSHTHKTPENAMRTIVNHDGDVFAATRRAIVIAAAEIARSQLSVKEQK